MDASAMEPTMAVAFPWLNMTFDTTDALAKLIPDGLIDWRPEDPSGKWCFSLGEIVMHSADSRIMFARQLSGNDSPDGYCSEGPGEDGVWKFKEHGGKQAIWIVWQLHGKKSSLFCRCPFRQWVTLPRVARRHMANSWQQ